MVIDKLTYERFLKAKEDARERGVPLVEALSYRRLLLTPALEREIAVGMLEEVIRRLNSQSPNRIMSYYYGRIEGTSTEMFEAMKQWLETICRHRADEILEAL